VNIYSVHRGGEGVQAQAHVKRAGELLKVLHVAERRARQLE
jgi:hypothetical protein